MILKLAFLSCVFYMGAAILMEMALLLVARFSGSSPFSASRSGWFVLFGLIWLGSFAIVAYSWTGLQSRLHP